MKTRSICSLMILWIVPNLIFGIQILNAQNNQMQSTQVQARLSGSDLKLEDAVSKADAVFVGKIIILGIGDTKARGEAVFRGIQVAVLRVLHGSVEGRNTTVTLRIDYVIAYHEDPPDVGSSYIFIVNKNDAKVADTFTVLKLIPATDANITRVNQLIK